MMPELDTPASRVAGVNSEAASARPPKRSSESVGLISNLKLERNKHSSINVTARKGGRLKTVLVQPHSHRAHLPRQVARIEAEFYGAHIL